MRSFPSINLFCLEQSVNNRVDLTQCPSADETTRDTVLAFPPETGRQVEESAVWLLRGNLFHPSFIPFLQSNLSTLTGKVIKKDFFCLLKRKVTRVTLHFLQYPDPENVMNALHSHGWSPLKPVWAYTVLCWQIQLGWLRTQPLPTEECRKTGATI